LQNATDMLSSLYSAEMLSHRVQTCVPAHANSLSLASADRHSSSTWNTGLTSSSRGLLSFILIRRNVWHSRATQLNHRPAAEASVLNTSLSTDSNNKHNLVNNEIKFIADCEFCVYWDCWTTDVEVNVSCKLSFCQWVINSSQLFKKPFLTARNLWMLPTTSTRPVCRQWTFTIQDQSKC